MYGLILALILVNLAIVFGATSFGPISIKHEYGKDVKYCQVGNVQMLPRSVFKNYATCEKCTCTKRGLECATMDTAASIQSVDDDTKCESVRIGCKNRWVRKNNNDRKCRKKDIPQILSMVGK